MENFSKNQKLWKAFEERKKKSFAYLLEIGANPEDVIEPKTKWSIFAKLCKNHDAGDYIKMCIENGTDPNGTHSLEGHHPIHIAVLHLTVQNITILLKSDADCVNQTLNFDKTPLHLISEVLDNSNLSTVFEIIQLFSKFGGDFSWPARQSGNQTPFQMLLEKLATLQDKATCLRIIRYLIGKYPKIDIFQRKKCASLIRRNFFELLGEYQVIESWRDEINSDRNFKLELTQLIVENEALFLVKFYICKNSDRKKLENTISGEEFLNLTILHDRFESFVEVYGMTFESIELDKVVRCILTHKRHRFLKYLLNHYSVSHIPALWVVVVVSKMEDQELPLDTNTLKCFHALVRHQKFNVNEQPAEYEGNTALIYAAAKSDYAALELLKRGASLGLRNNAGRMMIQYLDVTVLRNFFDTCITVSKPAELSDSDYYMVIDYSFLNSSKEMPPIEYIATAKDLQPLIDHPVVASSLFLKWLQLSTIFYINLLCFSLNVISFCVFLTVFYVDRDEERPDSLGFNLLGALSMGSFFIFLIKEVGQFVGSPTIFLKSFENYFEMALLCLMGVVLFLPYAQLQDHVRRTLTAIIIMGFSIEWTLIISAVPMFSVSNYIVMLKKVAVNFLRLLAFYSIILAAFGLSFYCLVDEKVTSMASTFFYTILMLAGDFSLNADAVHNVFVFRIFLIIFVLSITIVMMNLMVGLTVSDTATIEKYAQRHNWLERAKLLSKYEQIVWNICSWLRHLEWKRKLESMVQLVPEFLPMNKIKIEISTFDSNRWIFIPDPKCYGLIEEKSQDIEGDPFPLINTKSVALSRAKFGHKSIVTMDERIVQSGLEILERRQKIALKKEKKLIKKAYRDNIEQKLDRILNRM